MSLTPAYTQAPRQAGKPLATQEPVQTSGTITPELVKAVADRVYAMLLAELKIESERLGHQRVGNLYRGGK